MTDNYIVITSYDSISEFYCNKIYKKLNNFERKLKELIFDIYTFSYGINYYKRNFSDDLKIKVKRLSDKSIATDTKEVEQLKQSLYELDYKEHYEECLYLLKILNKQINKALKIVMNIDFQELNAQYANDILRKGLATLQESLSAFSKNIVNLMHETFNQMSSIVSMPMTDTLRKFRENVLMPLIDIKNVNNNHKYYEGILIKNP